MKQDGFVPLLIVILVAAVAAVGGYFVYQKSLISPTSPTPTYKACTQEAKICQDGSSVGRTGPNCEFTPCPTSATDSGQVTPQKECEVKNCHGLEISCGPIEGSKICTLYLGSGDVCIKYASCQIVSGNCQEVKNVQFDRCKACVEECSKKSNIKPFDLACEEKCD